jgi:hypothetical protein
LRNAADGSIATTSATPHLFHLVKLANDMVTAVRERVIPAARGRRGRLQDLAWVKAADVSWLGRSVLHHRRGSGGRRRHHHVTSLST